MDNTSGRLRYGPNRVVGAIAATLAVAGIVQLLLTDDRVGRSLYALATVTVAAVAASDLVWNPRLVIDRAGLSVRAPTGSLRLAWAEISAVRVEERLRFGLTGRTLEIESGDQLVLLSQRALGGVDPRDVAGTIEAFRS